MEVQKSDKVGVLFVLTASVTWGFRRFLGGFFLCCFTVNATRQMSCFILFYWYNQPEIELTDCALSCLYSYITTVFLNLCL